MLNLEDHNELVITRPLRLSLPPVGAYTAEDVIVDPNDVTSMRRMVTPPSPAFCSIPDSTRPPIVMGTNEPSSVRGRPWRRKVHPPISRKKSEGSNDVSSALRKQGKGG